MRIAPFQEFVGESDSTENIVAGRGTLQLKVPGVPGPVEANVFLHTSEGRVYVSVLPAKIEALEFLRDTPKPLDEAVRHALGSSARRVDDHPHAGVTYELEPEFFHKAVLSPLGARPF